MSIPYVAYAAKSTADTKDSTGSQLEKIAAAIPEDRVEYAGRPFKEENRSGYRGSRGPELEAAMRAAVDAAEKHGQAELWVFHSSRLARGSGRKNEARSLMEVHTYLRRRGVALRSVEDDPFVTNKMLVGVADEMAHKYAADLSSHVRRGKDQQFEKGEWLGGPVPDGFHIEKDERGRPTSGLLRDPAREPVIRRMFTLGLEGMAPAAIGRALNREGFRTVSRKAWDRRLVEDKLTSPVYCGAVVRHRGKPNQAVNWTGAHAEHAYITRAEHEAIVAMIKKRDRVGAKRRRPQSGRPSTRYALWKIAACGACGGPMDSVTSAYRRKDGTRRRVYLCQHVQRGTGECTAPAISAEDVDAWIVGNLGSLVVNMDEVFHAMARDQDAERTAAEQELADVDAALRKNEGQQERAELDYIEHAGDAAKVELITRGLARLSSQHDELQAKAANLQSALAEPRPDAYDSALDVYNELKARVSGAQAHGDNMADLNAFLREHFARVVLTTTPDGLTIQPVPDDDEAYLTIDFTEDGTGVEAVTPGYLPHTVGNLPNAQA